MILMHLILHSVNIELDYIKLITQPLSSERTLLINWEWIDKFYIESIQYFLKVKLVTFDVIFKRNKKNTLTVLRHNSNFITSQVSYRFSKQNHNKLPIVQECSPTRREHF